MKTIWRAIFLTLFLIGCAMVASQPSFAQIDIPIAWTGPNVEIGRNLVLGQTGPGGFNNNFVLSGLSQPTQNVCVYVEKPAGLEYTFQFSAFQTADPRNGSFTNNQTEWTRIPDYGLKVEGNIGRLSTYAVNHYGGSNIASILLAGVVGEKIALSFSGLASGDIGTSVNVFARQTNQNGCGAASQNGASFVYYNSGLTATTGDVVLLGKPFMTVALAPVDPSTLHACTFSLNVANVSGTAPTLNVYLQDYNSSLSADGVVNDRVSFLQVSTSTSKQQASVLWDATAAPAAVKNASLTAGSVTAGPLTDELHAHWVLGGTATPTFKVYLAGHCH